MGKVYRILFGEFERTRPFAEPNRIWDSNGSVWVGGGEME
jgi:hypothetical protein